jgi:hypothetical protein
MRRFTIFGLVVLVMSAGVLVSGCGSGESGANLGNATQRSARRQVPTKAEWWTKLEENKLKEPGQRLVMGVSTQDFFKVVGEPDRTQVMGEELMWYYDCKDGQIQMVQKEWLYRREHKIFTDMVNEY